MTCDQLGEVSAVIEGELRALRVELGVALVRELEREADGIAVEADRALQIRDEQDDYASLAGIEP